MYVYVYIFLCVCVCEDYIVDSKIKVGFESLKYYFFFGLIHAHTHIHAYICM